MEPVLLRRMLDMVDMALSDTSSEERDASPASDFEEVCPMDYCSRTEISLSFLYTQSGSPLCATGKLDTELAALVRGSHAEVFGTVCSDLSDRLQRYVLSDGLLRGAAVTATKAAGATTAEAHVYSRADIVSILDALRDSLTLYTSVSGGALYVRPYSGLLDDVFNASQLPASGVGSYIRTKEQTHPNAMAAILADVCAYRQGLLSCYQRLPEAPFSVALGSNFEALLCPRDPGGECFCLVSGYPGLLEALEQTLRRQPEPRAFTFRREGSSIYVSGDLAAVAGFLMYKIPLNIGLDATEKALPRIFCPRPFECSYKAVHLLHKIDDDAGRLTISGYLPSFVVRSVVTDIQLAMRPLDEKHLVIVELSPPTQHTRHFNALESPETVKRTQSTSKISRGQEPPDSAARCIAVGTRGFMLHPHL